MTEPLLFRFKDVIDELEEFRKTAKEFLFRDADSVLSGYIDQLRYLQSNAHKGEFAWEILERRPLQTRASFGLHDPSGKGIDVYGSIDAKWAIKRVPHPSGKNRPADEFAMAGEASVRIRIRATTKDDEDRRSAADPELAMWRMELGDLSSPGCHFHVQVLGQTPEAPFPGTLAVPRLPSIAVTPAAAFEYVIGELFQSEWTKHVVESQARFTRWRKLQCDALTQLLKWQIEKIEKAPASPWTTLKQAKPEGCLFSL